MGHNYAEMAELIPNFWHNARVFQVGTSAQRFVRLLGLLEEDTLMLASH